MLKKIASKYLHKIAYEGFYDGTANSTMDRGDARYEYNKLQREDETRDLIGGDKYNNLTWTKYTPQQTNAYNLHYAQRFHRNLNSRFFRDNIRAAQRDALNAAKHYMYRKYNIGPATEWKDPLRNMGTEEFAKMPYNDISKNFMFNNTNNTNNKITQPVQPPRHANNGIPDIPGTFR